MSFIRDVSQFIKSSSVKNQSWMRILKNTLSQLLEGLITRFL